MKVRVHINPMFNPQSARTRLNELGITHQIEKDGVIECRMSETQRIDFLNSRGAAHRLEIVQDGK
jgi:hypothetical protein